MASIRSLTYTFLFVLRGVDFDALVSKYPKFRQKLEAAAAARGGKPPPPPQIAECPGGDGGSETEDTTTHQPEPENGDAESQYAMSFRSKQAREHPPSNLWRGHASPHASVVGFDFDRMSFLGGASMSAGDPFGESETSFGVRSGAEPPSSSQFVQNSRMEERKSVALLQSNHRKSMAVLGAHVNPWSRHGSIASLGRKPSSGWRPPLFNQPRSRERSLTPSRRASSVAAGASTNLFNVPDLLLMGDMQSDEVDPNRSVVGDEATLIEQLDRGELVTLALTLYKTMTALAASAESQDVTLKESNTRHVPGTHSTDRAAETSMPSVSIAAPSEADLLSQDSDRNSGAGNPMPLSGGRGSHPRSNSTMGNSTTSVESPCNYSFFSDAGASQNQFGSSFS